MRTVVREELAAALHATAVGPTAANPTSENLRDRVDAILVRCAEAGWTRSRQVDLATACKSDPVANHKYNDVMSEAQPRAAAMKAKFVADASTSTIENRCSDEKGAVRCDIAPEAVHVGALPGPKTVPEQLAVLRALIDREKGGWSIKQVNAERHSMPAFTAMFAGWSCRSG